MTTKALSPGHERIAVGNVSGSYSGVLAGDSYNEINGYWDEASTSQNTGISGSFGGIENYLEISAANNIVLSAGTYTDSKRPEQ